MILHLLIEPNSSWGLKPPTEVSHHLQHAAMCNASACPSDGSACSTAPNPNQICDCSTLCIGSLITFSLSRTLSVFCGWTAQKAALTCTRRRTSHLTRSSALPSAARGSCMAWTTDKPCKRSSGLAGTACTAGSGSKYCDDQSASYCCSLPQATCQLGESAEPVLPPCPHSWPCRRTTPAQQACNMASGYCQCQSMLIRPYLYLHQSEATSPQSNSMLQAWRAATSIGSQ